MLAEMRDASTKNGANGPVDDVKHVTSRAGFWRGSLGSLLRASDAYAGAPVGMRSVGASRAEAEMDDRQG